MKTKLPFIAALLLLSILHASAQIPAHYYAKANGKSGRNLKTALHQIINEPNVVLYDSLWTAYTYTDAIPTDTVPIIWDMYSNISAYSVYTKLHGNGTEGVRGFQREHSMPKSWFNPEDRNNSGKLTYNDVKPMYSDLVHVIPTDGTVNNKRSNNAYGEVNDESLVEWTSANGFSRQSKKGGCTVEGWKEQVADYQKQRVFEPNDEYKGDLARIYFYMATCYEDKAGTWTSDMFDAASDDGYQPFAPWAFDMLMRWAKNDPVSEKEIARNEAVWQLQGNRNPFVDYPGLEEYIWGDKMEEAFDSGQEDKEPVEAVSCNIEMNNGLFGVDWSENENLRTYFERTPLVTSYQGVDITFNYGIEGGNLYADEGHIRLYNYNTLTFEVAPCELTSITFTVTYQDEGKNLTASTGAVENNTWTGRASRVQFYTDYVASVYDYKSKKSVAKYLELSDVSLTVEQSAGIGLLQQSPVYDNRIYNMMGVEIDSRQLTPGIYIRNGRKFIYR